MNKIDWKRLLLTSFICLIPMILGLIYWKDLPNQLATHLNLSGEVNGTTPKTWFVISLPLILLACQVTLGLVVDLTIIRQVTQIRILTWLFPLLAAGTTSLTLLHQLGMVTDLRKPVIALIALTWLVVGNYGTKKDLAFLRMETPHSKKLRHQTAYGFIIVALLLLVSLLFPISVTFAILMLATFSMAGWSFYCALTAYLKR